MPPTGSTASTNEVVRDDLGLSIDMLDVDRLRDWARLLLVHGSDISHWASVPFVASKLQILATDLEKAVCDIGTLRAARPHELLARWQEFLANGGFWNPDSMDADALRDLAIDTRDFLAGRRTPNNDKTLL